MAPSLVLAEQFTEPAVTGALREHRADRSALLASLKTSLDADARVRAAWLCGSFGRNEADDLSDLDLWVIVADNAMADFGPSSRRYAARAGNLISGGEKPRLGPIGGGYFGSLHEGRHGLLHLDCYWQPQSAEIVVPERAVLLNRMGEAMLPSASTPTADAKTEAGANGVRDGLGFAWLMFSIAAKYLARDPSSDMGLMLFPRPGLEQAAALLGMQNTLPPDVWSVPDTCLEKVGRLRALVDLTERLMRAATREGAALPTAHAPCLRRYLDLVDGVLRRHEGAAT